MQSLQDRGLPVLKTCFLHGPRHSSEECKVLKEYYKKCAVQQPHKDNEAHPGGETNRGKSIELGSSVNEASTMEHCDPIPKRRGGTSKKYQE